MPVGGGVRCCMLSGVVLGWVVWGFVVQCGSVLCCVVCGYLLLWVVVIWVVLDCVMLCCVVLSGVAVLVRPIHVA